MLRFVQANEPCRTIDDFIHSTEGKNHQVELSGASESRTFYDEVVFSPSTTARSQDGNLSGRGAVGHSGTAVDVVSVGTTKSGKSRPSNLTTDHLLRAAADGNMRQLTEFVSRGFPVDSVDMFGWTALMCAAQKGNFDAVIFLIKSGVCYSAKNKKNQTAADIAELSRQHKISAYLREMENYEKVDGTGCEVISDKDGQSERLESFFCDICGVTFHESSPRDHQSSTIHLLSSGFSPTPRPSFELPPSNIGFRLMKKIGWDHSKGLGASEDGRWYPLRTVFKQDRQGLGKRKYVAKVTHYPHLIEKETVRPLGIMSTRRDMEKDLRRGKRKEINLRRSLHGI